MSKRLAPQKNLHSEILTRNSPRAVPRIKPDLYEAFDKIDGQHPWQEAVPEGYVPYQVRKLDRGKVVYFNFALAREMGLLNSGHPEQLTPALTQKIIDTFSIQIINEYDITNGTRAAKDSIKENRYMATRYLQLQHASKRGTTSGDGRSIWNGQVRHRGTVWDVSSRGTGVTCLAPGAVLAEKPLKTGEGEFGYGCGLADVTELLGSAIMSEIFHLNQVQTERVLAVIDLGKGCGIGVRAAPNLIRPAHLFLYLKQGRLDVLRRAVDFLIDRQIENGAWKFSRTSQDKYACMLKELSTSFAKFAARMEREYIFTWMEWDGDNVLASAGIIDYGSIRQFGLRHDQYRYDDVERFSTTLNEQRGKARLMIQVFAQAVAYLESGKRKTLEDFANHGSVRDYDREFDRELRRVFLNQVGFTDDQATELLKTNAASVEKLYVAFLVLEKAKTRGGVKKLPDGINKPALFNMRRVLREMPASLSEVLRQERQLRAPLCEDILELMNSCNTKKADRRLRGGLRERITAFSQAYIALVGIAAGKELKAYLKTMATRASEINRADRITGNGAEFIVEAIIKAKRRGLSFSDIQGAIDLFVASQAPKSSLASRRARATSVQSPSGLLFQELVHIAHDFEEDI